MSKKDDLPDDDAQGLPMKFPDPLQQRIPFDARKMEADEVAKIMGHSVEEVVETMRVYEYWTDDVDVYVREKSERPDA